MTLTAKICLAEKYAMYAHFVLFVMVQLHYILQGENNNYFTFFSD